MKENKTEKRNYMKEIRNENKETENLNSKKCKIYIYICK